jgi:hypothetical protein
MNSTNDKPANERAVDRFRGSVTLAWGSVSAAITFLRL